METNFFTIPEWMKGVGRVIRFIVGAAWRGISGAIDSRDVHTYGGLILVAWGLYELGGLGPALAAPGCFLVYLGTWRAK